MDLLKKVTGRIKRKKLDLETGVSSLINPSHPIFGFIAGRIISIFVTWISVLNLLISKVNDCKN